MFLLICKARISLTKTSHFTHRRTHTHTHTYVSLALREWTLKKATSWPPWKLTVLLRSTKKKLATQWHGNHELMSKCCHTLRGCQIFWPWPWDSKTCIKFDQSTYIMLFSKNFSFVSQWIEWKDEVVRICCLCNVCCTETWQELNDDLASAL